MDEFNKLNTGQKYLIMSLPLVISSLLLAICVNERMNKKGHCDKSNEQLCLPPKKKTENGVDEYSCDGNQLKKKKYSDYLKYTFIPINVLFTITNIIFLIFEFSNSSSSSSGIIISKYISSIIILFLIIVSLLQIIFYYIYRKNCLDNDYECILVNTLVEPEDDDNKNKGYKIPILTCNNTLHKSTHTNYKVAKNFNKIILVILIFMLLLYLYEIDIQYNLLSVTDGHRFSSYATPPIVITCVLILIFINLHYNGKVIQYVLNSISGLLIVFTLYMTDYFSFIIDLF
jgi:uncharacterized membrane protein